MEGLLHSAPGDELVIKLYALRLRLCQMMKDKKMDTQVGIDLFEIERQRAIDRRTLEDQQTPQALSASLVGTAPIMDRV